MAFAVSAALGLTLLFGLQEPAARPNMVPPRELPVSLGRIRQQLKKPEPKKLFVPPSQADFSIQVIEKQRFQDLLSLIDFGSGPAAQGGLYAHQQRQMFGQITGRQVSEAPNVDVLAPAGALVKAIAKARRERAERLAREEVRGALVNFCAQRGCIVDPISPADASSPER